MEKIFLVVLFSNLTFYFDFLCDFFVKKSFKINIYFFFTHFLRVNLFSIKLQNQKKMLASTAFNLNNFHSPKAKYHSSTPKLHFV